MKHSPSGSMTVLPTDQIRVPEPASIQDLVERWLTRRSPRTREAYGADLADFSRFLGLVHPRESAKRLLSGSQGEANVLADRYRGSLIERKLAPATVNRRLASLRSLVALARLSGLVAWELVTLSEKVLAARDVRGPGSAGVVKLLRAAAEGRGGARDVALIRLAHDLGLRRFELVTLDFEDVDLEARRLRVRGKGRGGQAEWLTMPGPTINALTAYLASRGSQPGPFFLRRDRRTGPGRLTGRGVAVLLARLSSSAGVPLVRPHGLRHAGATAIARALGNAEALRRWGRWSGLGCPVRYLDSTQDLAGKAAEVAAASLG